MESDTTEPQQPNEEETTATVNEEPETEATAAESVETNNQDSDDEAAGATADINEPEEQTNKLSSQGVSNDSENESEEVDDIELIFTTEETHRDVGLQEDLVSIVDTEHWQQQQQQQQRTPTSVSRFHINDLLNIDKECNAI